MSNNTTLLPNTLIIGAMKCGTTTLFRDLACSREVVTGVDKEAGVLKDGGSLRPRAIGSRNEGNQGTGGSRIVVDASTDYSKYPQYVGFPERARSLLGPRISIIYCVRDPIDRIASHVRHDVAQRRIGTAASLTRALDDDVVAVSKYGMQLEQWLAHFPQELMHVVKFEDLVLDRRRVARALAHFLQIDDYSQLVDDSRSYNSSSDQRVVRGWLKWGRQSRLYLGWVRPRLSMTSRENLRKLLIRREDFGDAGTLNADVKEELRARLLDDQRLFASIVGWNHFSV